MAHALVGAARCHRWRGKPATIAVPSALHALCGPRLWCACAGVPRCVPGGGVPPAAAACEAAWPAWPAWPAWCPRRPLPWVLCVLPRNSYVVREAGVWAASESYGE